MDLKARTTGKITATQCATLYRDNLTVAKTSEPITDSFVDKRDHHLVAAPLNRQRA